MTRDYDMDDGTRYRATLGVIVLQVDETLESDLRHLLADDVRILHARIPSGAELTAESIHATMADTLGDVAALLPGAAGMDAIGYACTSGATVLGEDRVAELIHATHPGVPVSTPLGALKAACAALGVSRLGLVSPYVADVSDALIENLHANAIDVATFTSFDQREERRVARITPASISEAMRDVGSDEGSDAGRDESIEAVFASCTNLRAVDVRADMERELGKPVLTSTHVLAWHMLRLAGIDDPLPAFGRLGEV